ncbi:MAG TPA: SAM-dependent methyltransferase [Sphingomicrobium sp.]|nr:SAM-dependent methyltransferase [Sphingomicrobium sp.]
MTPFERALRERIQLEGPITVEAFMEACNAYYYATRDPLGAAGDFTTAPEISQMFGEMIGAALIDCWRRAGAPRDAVYAELGPGRATLASDALRMMRSAKFPGGVHFVETSPVLRELQRRVAPEALSHERVQDLPAVPMLVVANEFLDALPVRQHIGGKERHVVIEAGGLAFDRGGAILETSPARDETVAAMADHLVKNGGVALFIDYGHKQAGMGETLQAVHRHGSAPVLASPGEQDLTSHVDFEAVGRSARGQGASVTSLATQGEWLVRLGIETRAKKLALSNPGRAGEIAAALERLASEDQMGRLFKVIAIHSPQWPAPAGF